MTLRYPVAYVVLYLGIAVLNISSAKAQNGGAWASLKGAGVGSRQVAYAAFQPGISPTDFVGDSTTYHYVTNSTDKFFETSGYNGTRGSMVYYGKSAYVRNAQGQPLLVYSLKWQSATSTFDTLGRTTYTRNAAGDNIFEINESRTTTIAPWVPGSRHTRVYNAIHQLIKITSERWRPAALLWDTTGQYEYTYNAQGSITKMIYRYWLQATHQLDYVDSSLTTFDASGMDVLRDSTYQWKASTGIYKPKNRSFNTLNGSGQVVISLYDLWNSATSAWVPGGKKITSYTSAGYPAADTSYLWVAASNNYLLNSRVLHDWNSFGQEMKYYVEAYNGGVWEHNFSYFIYYEPYNDLGITPSSVQALLLDLSPVPASDGINVSMQWQVPQMFTLVVTDMQGRVYEQISGAASKQNSLIVPVVEYPAGNYLLTIKGASGAGFARIFTVQH